MGWRGRLRRVPTTATKTLAWLAVVPLVVGVAACTGDAEQDELPQASVGDVLEAGLTGSIEGRHTYVVLPGRRYDFTTSTPQERIDTVTAGDAGVSATADDDRRFVSIGWSLDVVPGDTFVMAPRDEVSPVLTLVADGERHEVGALDEEGRYGAVVVVPEDVDDISLEVEYDGLTQVIEDAYDQVINRADGPPSLYLDAPRLTTTYCETGRLRGGDPRVGFFGGTSVAQVSSPVPYVGALGWAPSGRAWVVADVTTDAVRSAGWDGADYVEYAVDSTVRVTLDGAEPVELHPRDEGETTGLQDDGSWAATAVFDVAQADGDVMPDLRRVLVGTAEDEDDARAAGAPEVLRRVQTCAF